VHGAKKNKVGKIYCTFFILREKKGLLYLLRGKILK